MRIVSLEDDEPFWDILKEALKEEFQDTEPEWIRTEFEFCGKLSDFALAPPDIFLLDVMVKWSDPAEVMPPVPQDVEREGYYRAGLRCRERLRRHLATSSVPVILFTVLEEQDIDQVTNGLPEDTYFVGKSGDFEELIKAIKRVTSRSSTSPPPQHPSAP